MHRARRVPLRPLTLVILLAVLVAVPAVETGAQVIFGKPYIAAFAGMARTDFRLGPGVQDLDWRDTQAFEIGFELMGVTISPGFMKVTPAEWTSEDGNLDFELTYNAYYLNLGAREDVGIYFAGGLNLVQWEALPQESELEPLRADSEIGFQAFLGFGYKFDRLPIKLLFEGGYVQVNGNVTSAPGFSVALQDVSSSGPMLRFGIALGG
jgi:hypothetical protein